MYNQRKQDDKQFKIERVFGIILLVPSLISVLLFLISLLSNDAGKIPKLTNLSSEWTGNYSSEGGGYTSAAPIYFGLMAIAGALLLKSND